MPPGFKDGKTVAAGPVDSVYNRPLAPGESFILDFGEHLTGQFFLSLRQFDVPVDAPVRLAFIFGETPAELAEPFDPYSGGLTRAWLQDEVVNFDDVPQTTSLPPALRLPVCKNYRCFCQPPWPLWVLQFQSRSNILGRCNKGSRAIRGGSRFAGAGYGFLADVARLHANRL